MSHYIPHSSYRVQLNKEFTFNDLVAILPYLKKLGIDTIYTSPFFKAIPGSMHGYNVTDPNCINPEIGSNEDFDNYLKALKENDLKQIIDIVPNHMGVIGGINLWWQDVLEQGRNSVYEHYFDIQWDSPNSHIKNKILLPVLGDYYGRVIDKKEIQLSAEGDSFYLNYFAHKFPIRKESYAKIQSKGVEAYNGKENDPESFKLLEDLLEEQHYRLCYWRVAIEEINYRRFFDINELAAIRIEQDDVFEKYHSFISQLIKEDSIQGLRIDHPDGLYDPKKYFKDLKSKLPKEVYIIIEKILEQDEKLDTNWSLDGTVGYDYLNFLNGIFVKQENDEAFTQLYEKFINHKIDFEELLYQKKKKFALINMAAEINNLGYKLEQISKANKYYRDFTKNNLIEAISEVIACFPVYRTYIAPNDKKASKRDENFIKIAINKAKIKSHFIDEEINFLEKILLFNLANISDEEEELYLNFILKFQQLTGPVMAKGLEDTAMYIYNKLLSLNEVGGDPNTFGISSEEFHNYNLYKKAQWPYSFLASSTHDNKRSEDLRARINVLSEIPQIWQEQIQQWSSNNAQYKTKIGNLIQPLTNMEYFIYQTLLGVWQPDAEPSTFEALKERVLTAALKSIREAKTYTSWLHPNQEYEDAVQKFISQILSDKVFLASFLEFQKKISFFGELNSLSAQLIRIGSPGVFDLYQGNESWDYSLVDPDNRRPVDFAYREQILDDLSNASFSLEKLQQEQMKFFVTYQGLKLRNKNKLLFLEGDYIPLEIIGKRKNNVIAFMRKYENDFAIFIASRFYTELIPDPSNSQTDWFDTRIILPKEFDFNENTLVKDIFNNQTHTINSLVLELKPLLTKLNLAILIKEKNSPV